MKIFEIYNTYNYELSYIKANNKEHAYQLKQKELSDYALEVALRELDEEEEQHYYNTREEMLNAQRESQLSAFMDELVFTELSELSTEEYESIKDNYYCEQFEYVESDLMSDFDYRFSFEDKIIGVRE